MTKKWFIIHVAYFDKLRNCIILGGFSMRSYEKVLVSALMSSVLGSFMSSAVPHNEKSVVTYNGMSTNTQLGVGLSFGFGAIIIAACVAAKVKDAKK